MAERRPQGEQGPRPRALTAAEIKARQAPWYPKDYGIGDVAAIKNIAAGTATPEQQRHGMQWIINTLCGTYDQPFRPGGEDGRRDTDLACGMMLVGQQLVKIINVVDLTKLAKGEPREQG